MTIPDSVPSEADVISSAFDWCLTHGLGATIVRDVVAVAEANGWDRKLAPSREQGAAMLAAAIIAWVSPTDGKCHPVRRPPPDVEAALEASRLRAEDRGKKAAWAEAAVRIDGAGHSLEATEAALVELADAVARHLDAPSTATAERLRFLLGFTIITHSAARARERAATKKSDGG